MTKRVEDLAARRDGIDAEVAERRIRENEALEYWVSLAVEREEIVTTRDDELARLETERSRVREDAAQRIALVDAQHADVLLALSRDSRTAHQLSALFELPLKQVRDMVRAAKTRETTTATSSQAPSRTGTSAAEASRRGPAAEHTMSEPGFPDPGPSDRRGENVPAVPHLGGWEAPDGVVPSSLPTAGAE